MKRMTKTAKRNRAAASRKKTGLIKAVRSLLKKANPSARITGARVVKLKGGGLTIRPIKANPGGGAWTVDAWHGGGGIFRTKKAAMEHAKRLREANAQAGNRGAVKVKKLGGSR